MCDAGSAPQLTLHVSTPSLNCISGSSLASSSATIVPSTGVIPTGTINAASRLSSVLHDDVAESLRAAVAAAESVEKAAIASAAAARQALKDYLTNAGPCAKKRKRKRTGDGGSDVVDDGGGAKARISYAARKWYDFQDVCRLGSMIESGEIREGQARI